jgi:hypothetical protein
MPLAAMNLSAEEGTPMSKKGKPLADRFGVAELYGNDFTAMDADTLRKLAKVSHKTQPCRFRGGMCNKARGVCTLRRYSAPPDAKPPDELLVSVCPQRLTEAGLIWSWVGEELLGTKAPAVVKEVDFLLSSEKHGDEAEAVGRLDTILVAPDSEPMRWCAVELQAVYFSGKGMKSQFAEFAKWRGPGIPFPNEVRRPDYRSSGPKRLLPQLQVKVPTLRRWGKKMAVVTDRAFFESLGKMPTGAHLSSSDLAWFVVDYEPSPKGYTLRRHAIHYLTLERAIEGLVGGEPLSAEEFERRIRAKLSAPPRKDRGR